MGYLQGDAGCSGLSREAIIHQQGRCGFPVYLKVTYLEAYYLIKQQESGEY